MHIVFDVVDLLQLHEIWSLRPIVTAFSRLERRETPPFPGPMRFDVAELVPRLTRLRHSPDWKTDGSADDPARVSIRDLTEAHFSQLYPDTEASAVRHALFCFAYRSFVVARYQAAVQPTGALLRALANRRELDADIYLDADGLPRQGSPDWIPADITDDIRGLDARCRPTEPDTPAAYVIADSFWSLLVKANAAEIEDAARHYADTETQQNQSRQALTALVELAGNWNRSPSVVGLSYQVHAEDNVS